MSVSSFCNTTLLLSIEGNIGAGKSTLLEGLKKAHPEWVFIDEPVGNWLLFKDEASGKSLLELYYEDRKRWGYTFQTRVLLTRMQTIRQAFETWKEARVFILERSLESDRALFAMLMKEEGDMNSIEWQLYEEWYSHIHSLVPAVEKFVWLDIAPDICAERIQKRAREGEDGICLQYLMDMQKVHQEWLGAMPASHCIRVDTNAVETISKAIHSRWLSNCTK
jgi:deoxyadenosine/deoxycytidine kinase